YCGAGAKYFYTTCDVGPRGNLGIITNFLTEFWQGHNGPNMTTSQALQALDDFLGPDADRTRIMQAFSLGPYPGSTTVNDAKIVHYWVLTKRFKGVGPLTIFNVRGGNASRCTNQKVNMLLYGVPAVEPVFPECGP